MKILFAVTYVSGTVAVVEFASEDGEHYQAPTKDWAKVAEPKRIVLWDRQVHSAEQVPCYDGSVTSASLKLQGNLNEWFVAKGVYEFWTASREVADAAVATLKLASGIFSRNPYYGDNPPM